MKGQLDGGGPVTHARAHKHHQLRLRRTLRLVGDILPIVLSVSRAKSESCDAPSAQWRSARAENVAGGYLGLERSYNGLH
jgi:hypothetical protein